MVTTEDSYMYFILNGVPYVPQRLGDVS